MAEETVGLVVAGAGARGAYEAGVLSVLLPALAEQGRRPKVFVGTSAGALNVLLFASMQHLPPDEAAVHALRTWREACWDNVVRPLLPTVLRDGSRYVGQVLRVPGVRLSSLLDPAPLRRMIDRWGHWPELHRNVQGGMVASIAAVATSSSTNQTTVFLEQRPGRPVPERDDDRGVDYAPVTLTGAHVLASAAIPVAFPAVRLADADGTDYWYSDGGVRLTAPIKPAIALGVDRVAIVATHPLESRPVPGGGPAPDVFDATAQVLHAAMVDRMVEDVRTLDKVNRLLPPEDEGRVWSSTGGRAYRRIPRIFIGPPRHGLIGAVADEVLARRRRAPEPPLDFDLVALRRALGGGRSAGELLSYLLFDPVFIDRLIEMGQRDARELLDPHGPQALWRLGDDVSQD